MVRQNTLMHSPLFRSFYQSVVIGAADRESKSVKGSFVGSLASEMEVATGTEVTE